MKVYRISSKEYIKDLSGRGAWLNGGRWNNPFKFMLYTSESLSLATVEILVHIRKEYLPDNLQFAKIVLPNNATIINIPIDNLPENWGNSTDFSTTRKIGNEWLDSKESLILKVPSAVIPSENNFLINPLHPDFDKVTVESIEIFNFNKRLFLSIK